MKNTLFIIGNGFDKAHGLPTDYLKDFKPIAEKHEENYFWDLYQSKEATIWAHFENLLAYPDFNQLEEMFNGYEPDYSSDRESDRDDIINQAELNEKLFEALYEFVNNAEECLNKAKKNPYIEKILCRDGYYITFNYTHTLEKIYGIPKDNILHIHGEAESKNLIFGYPKPNFKPEKYLYDVRSKGRGPYAKMDIEEYINSEEDYYKRTAHKKLFTKCKSFYKESQIDLLDKFLNEKECIINEIIIYGHSCEIDFDYFAYINIRYPKAHWTFYIYDDDHQNAANNLVSKYKIINCSFEKLTNK